MLTDGSVIGDSTLSYQARFVKCPECGVFLIVDSSVEKFSAVHFPFDVHDFHSVNYLSSVDEYCQAINHGICNSGTKGSEKWKQDKLKLRVNLWRAFNNLMLDGHDLSSIIGLNTSYVRDIYNDNCRKILSLLSDRADRNSIVKAELYRNIGEFGKCESLLRGIAYSEQQNPALDTFLSDRAETEEYNSWWTVLVTGVSYEDYFAAVQEECRNRNTLTVEIKAGY